METRAKTYLTIDQVKQLEEAATNLQDRLLIRLLSHLGCRISEILALKGEDIDYDRGTVNIQHLKNRLNLACPSCNTRLGKSHAFCPCCGSKKVGDLEIDSARHQDFLRGAALELSPKEFDLLVFLAKNKGSVFNREEAFR